ncbi:methyltransferase domain-containing protein [Lentzea sp. NEAU-D13]|uniref:Methyltransferase domain-containing protein n=1 Tax=Lentzea alba TaxID=2714351 RepID=A0A7C9RXC4_9PSEU|nr:methyltransferase domain-containing protein [Lentzea alba]
MTYWLAAAEDTGLPAHAWDVVSAGQCWHWFDRPRAAAEARRLLAEDGVLAICYRDYVTTPGSVAAASEELVPAHHPGWPLAKGIDSHPERIHDLGTAGSTTWRRSPSASRWNSRTSSGGDACAVRTGVAASLPAAAVAAFDSDLARLLRQRFPQEPLTVPHRFWGLVARCGRRQPH